MTTSTPANSRVRLIKLIHVAKRERGMDEPTYRTLLRVAGKADSTAKMAVPALLAVLERFQKDGFVIRPKAGDRRQTFNPEASKVRALWLFLHVLGVVRDPSERALAAYVKRIGKVDDLRWARGEVPGALIETLKKWAMRYLPAAVKALAGEVTQLHQAEPLNDQQRAWVMHAKACLDMGQGFDMHWLAWQLLMDVLGRPVAPEVKGIEA